MGYTINLSHNHFGGYIPETFSNLKVAESLDISYNELTGQIPLQLIELNNLAIFSVAHNNLSGKTLERKFQFMTFDQSSYEGNPLLCGLPLEQSCTPTGPPTSNTANFRKRRNWVMESHIFVEFCRFIWSGILGHNSVALLELLLQGAAV